jgi:hypothetical protein
MGCTGDRLGRFGSRPVIEIGGIEPDALDSGRREDGHDEHRTPLYGIGKVRIRFDERPFDHSSTVTQIYSWH